MWVAGPFRAPRRREVISSRTLWVSKVPSEVGPGAEQDCNQETRRRLGAERLAREHLLGRFELPSVGKHTDDGRGGVPSNAPDDSDLAEEALGELGVGLRLGQLPAKPVNLGAIVRRDGR